MWRSDSIPSACFSVIFPKTGSQEPLSSPFWDEFATVPKGMYEGYIWSCTRGVI